MRNCVITSKTGRKHLTVSNGPNECRVTIELYQMAREKTDQQIVHVSTLKYKCTKGIQEVLRLDEEIDKNAVCHQFYSTCTANTLSMKPLKGLETSK
jgi:hypothetical protein